LTLALSSQTISRFSKEVTDVLEHQGKRRRDVLVRAHVPLQPLFRHGAVTLVFDISEGEIEGTDVRRPQGRRHRRYAKVMTELATGCVRGRSGDGRPGQQARPGLRGQLGGPMAALAPLVGEMLGVERAKIDVQHDGLRHGVRVGDEIAFEIEDIVPFGVETGRPVRFDACSTRWRRT
jgi:hypothetical protein